jgi:hypothetical protein
MKAGGKFLGDGKNERISMQKNGFRIRAVSLVAVGFELVAPYKALGGGRDASTTAPTATHPLRGAAAPVAFSRR